MTRTKRRRFLWCAWWTGEPHGDPFRAPDAWAGGARTEEEARRLAEQAAGTPLEPIGGRWAGAWVRVQAGLPPFAERARPRPPGSAGAGAPGAPGAPPADGAPGAPVSPHALLGVSPGASLEEVKAAFRRKALEHHPDRGGQAPDFIAVKRAYDRLVARLVKPRARRRA